MAPSRSEISSSGTMRSGSKNSLAPMPSQLGQGPGGLLDENMRGVISGYETPQVMQANLSENSKSAESSSSTGDTLTMPSASLSPSSIESVSRCRMSAFTARRST